MINSVNISTHLMSALNENQRQVKNQELQENREIQVEQKQAEHKNIEQSHQDRVEHIRQAVKDGGYKIDLQATSEKMALNLLNL